MKKLVSFVGAVVIGLSLMVPSLAEARGFGGGHSSFHSSYHSSSHTSSHTTTHSSPSHSAKTPSAKPKTNITKTPSVEPKTNLTKNTDSTGKKTDKSTNKKPSVSLSKTPKPKSVMFRTYSSSSSNFFNLFSGVSVFGHSNGFYYRPYYTPYYGYHSLSSNRSMIGQEGIVVKSIPANGTGLVDINGQQWNSVSASGKVLQKATKVVVRSKNGSTLSVEGIMQ